VHVQNCEFQYLNTQYEVGKNAKPTEFVPLDQQRTFKGILRKNGEVATRNYIGIISSVNCSATVVKKIKERFANVSEE